MKKYYFISIFLITIIVLFLVRSITNPDVTLHSPDRFSSIMKKGELNVGYMIFPPYIKKDPVTGKLSGIFYDFTEEMGERLSLKINWVEEVTMATFIESIDSGKIDMMAHPIWMSATRAKHISFTTPLLYSNVGAYVRCNDTKFFAKEDKPPLVHEIIRGASKANLRLKPFGILQKWTNAAPTLNRKKGIGIF